MYRIVAGLQQACGKPVKYVQAYGRPATGLLHAYKILQACGRPAAGLWEACKLYRPVTGLLQACCRPITSLQQASILIVTMAIWDSF